MTMEEYHEGYMPSREQTARPHTVHYPNRIMDIPARRV